MPVLAFPAKTDPHQVGDAFCMGCNHTWAGAAPVGVVELECPGCRCMKGRFKFPCCPPVGELWTCNCGNQLFNLALDGHWCPNCGTYQKY